MSRLETAVAAVNLLLLIGSSTLTDSKRCKFMDSGRPRNYSINVCSYTGSLETASSSDKCMNCTQVDISNNNLTSLYKENLDRHPNLITLWASNNSISSLDAGTFSSPARLVAVILSYNKLSHLPINIFNNNTRLQRVYLDNNPLILPKRGPFLKSSSLLYLDLSSCNLTHISPDIFSAVPELSRLFLADNKLTELSADVFYPLKQLLFLNISLNMIKSLNFIEPIKITEVSAENTPLIINVSDTYLMTLSSLTLSRNVCRCAACTDSETLTGEEWFTRCTHGQPKLLTTTTRTTASTTAMLPRYTTEIWRTMLNAKDDTKIEQSNSGSILIITVLLSVLLCIVTIVLVFILIKNNLKKRRSQPPPPNYIAYCHHTLPCQHSYCNVQNSQVTDLDAVDSVNHLYERVPDK